MKSKFLVIAAACAAFGTQAFALTVAQTQAAQIVFHLAGSSALQKVIAKALSNNCATGTLTTFSGLLGSAAASSGDNANGQSQTVYSCTISGTNYGAANTGKTLAVYLRSGGGSAYGVFPVAANTAIAFANITGCSDSTLTCSTVVNATPDAGVSDLEPVAFNDVSNHPVDNAGNDLFPGASVTPGSFASSFPVAVQTFGLLVNNKLFTDLQADQGLSGTAAPSISSSAFATIYASGYSTGAIANWTPLFNNGSGTPNNQVNICSRLPGSGTRASAQALFLQAPFSSLAQIFANPSIDNTGDISTIGQNNAGTYVAGEFDNSAAVQNCVLAAETNNGYAVGIISVDRDVSTINAKFVQLDNQTPNSTAARFGKYPWVYEAFYQVNKHATDSAFAVAFGNAFKTPANITALGAPSTNGVMATVGNCALPYTGVNAVCSHVSRGGDYRAALQYAK